MVKVGLLGPQDGLFIKELSRAIIDGGGSVNQIDLGYFPDRLKLVVDQNGLCADGVYLDKLDVIYSACEEYMSPVPAFVPRRSDWDSMHGTIDDTIRSHQEIRSVRASVMRLLSDRCVVINSAWAQRSALMAPALLRRFEANGIPVAPFVSGNDLELIAYFVDEHEQNCRVRRLFQSCVEESLADFTYLKEHHNDLDRFPCIVRKSMGPRLLSMLVIGESVISLDKKNPEIKIKKSGAGNDALSELALRCCALAGLHVACVYMEQDLQGDFWVAGIDANPDLEQLTLKMPALLNIAVNELSQLLLSRPERLVNREVIRPVGSGIKKDKKIRIGLAGGINNQEVVVLARALESLGAEAVPVELPLFPKRRALHESATGGRIGVIELNTLDGVFVRTTGSTSPLPDPEGPLINLEKWRELYPDFRNYVQDQGESFVFKYSILETLQAKIPVFNPPIAQEVHRTKIHQLFSLADADIPVPATLATNDKNACERFVEQQGGPSKVVVKPLAGIYKTVLLSEMGLDMALSQGPVILQKYVHGETIRAYLVDGKLIGAGKIIHNRNTVDSSVGQTGVEPVELPESVIQMGWKAARHLGLTWTGMDFMWDKEQDRYFILECNAAAMFANFSRMTGFDVPLAIAEILIAGIKN